MSTVSVIVVTHNSAATIGACLRSIAAAFRTTPCEILIVDTESSDATVSIVQAEAGTLRVAVLRSPNRGFGSAANHGASLATGEVLWFLNPDTRLPPQCGERLLQSLHTPRVVAVSGALDDRPGGTTEVYGEPFPSLRWYVRRRFRAPRTQNLPHFAQRASRGKQLKTPYSVPWLSGASLVVRADAFRSVGGFRETYFLYYEDVDLGRRLRMAGGVLLIDPTVRIQHTGGQSTGAAERLHASDAAEDRYFAEHRPWWERALLQMLRPLLRVRWGALLLAAVVCGALFSVPSTPWFVAVLAGILALCSAVVRVPDLGAHLLLSSLLIGQIFRFPFGTTMALATTDLLLPLVVGAWLVRAAHGSWTKSHSSIRRRVTLSTSKGQRMVLWSTLLPLLALLPGLLLALERLPVHDWVSAAAYAVRLLLLILLVPLGAHVLQRPQQIPLTLVGVSAILALLGVLQWRVFPSTTAFQSAIAAWLPPSVVSVQGWDPHQGRLFSTWLDPNLFGGMLVLGVAVLQTLPLPKRIVARLAALFGSVAILVALMLTKSRTSLIAFLVLLATSVLIARPWRRLSLLIAGTVLGLVLTPSFLSRVTTVNRLDPTTGLRVRSWQQAIEQTQRAPVLGLGYNTYGLEQRAVGNIQTTQLHSWAGADSSPLTLLATTGMWGAILFSLVLGAASWALLRRCLDTHNLVRAPSWVARAAFLGLVGLFAHAQFVQSLLSVQLAVPLALLLAAAFAERTPQYTKKTLAPST